MAQLKIRRLSHALGATVTGVDLEKPIGNELFEEIHQAYLDHLLLCFPGQDLSKEAFLRFTGLFGKIENLPDGRDPDAPGIMLVSNKPVNGKPWDGYKNGPAWHSDRSYNPEPTATIFMNAKELPEVGGDTLFANMYMAYDTLSDHMKAFIDPLWAIQDRSLGQVPIGMRLLSPAVVAKAAAASAGRAAAASLAMQPVARVHPETQRKSLYLTERARQFVGMPEEESRPIIDALNQHSVTYEFTYRHRWTVGDLVMWDNRCMLHKALCDYDLERDIRHMYRSSVVGEKVGDWYTPEAAAELATRTLRGQPQLV